MKLKVLKNHYFGGKYRAIGGIYTSNVKFGTSAVKNGLCEQINEIDRKHKKREAENKKKLKKLRNKK